MLWGGYDYDDHHPMPQWVKDLPTVQERFDACEERITRELTRYKGIIKDYDVMNEPVHATYFADELAGDSINWYAFKWAHAADPDAELYINEYNVEYDWGSAEEYRDLIIEIKENGGPVTGAGMQAHFWDDLRPNVSEVVRNVNIVAEAGLPIKFTEYDYGGNISQAQQAADFIKVLTIAFSHPSIVGMYCWGLEDEGAWRDNTGFFDSNLKPKLAADTLLYYTKTKWATNFDSEIEDGETLEFNAYYGNYNIEVDFNDTVKVFTIPCLKENEDSVFVLHESDAVLKGPQMIETGLPADDEVKLIFDKPINEGSVKRSDFKFFSNHGIGLEEVMIDPGNPNALILSLSTNVVKGDYISASYFPGTLEATDGSLAVAFGPAEILNPGEEEEEEEETNISEIFSEDSFKIFPNPANDIINIEYQSSPFKVTIYDQLGRQVYTENSNENNIILDVSRFKRGMFVIKLTDSKNNEYLQKVILN